MNIKNRRAFLSMIAVSEGTAGKGDNGYNVLVGGALFSSYADHPRIVVRLSSRLKSTAAGRYQILARYFDAYRHLLKLPDFSPTSQDAIALQMIQEQHALTDVDAGKIPEAIIKCKNIWASFPGAGYGQHEQAMSKLLAAYQKAGGAFA